LWNVVQLADRLGQTKPPHEPFKEAQDARQQGDLIKYYQFVYLVCNLTVGNRFCPTDLVMMVVAPQQVLPALFLCHDSLFFNAKLIVNLHAMN